MKAKKCRCWWWVQLLENLPDYWEQELAELMLPGAYIVHDRDTTTDEDGIEQPKRPHVHCMMEFGSPIVSSSALDVLPDVFGVKMVKPVPNKIGAYRYLLHLGQDDKAQYSVDDVIHLAGFRVDLSAVNNVEFADVYEVINDLKITNFAMLMSVLVEFRPEFVPYVSSHVSLVKSYIMDYAKSL